MSLKPAVLFLPLLMGAAPSLDIPPEIRPSGQYVDFVPKTDAVSVTYIGLKGVDPVPNQRLVDKRVFLLDTRGLPPGRYGFAAVAASVTGEQTRADFEVVVGGVPPAPVKPPPPPDVTPPVLPQGQFGLAPLAYDLVAAKVAAGDRGAAKALAEAYAGVSGQALQGKLRGGKAILAAAKDGAGTALGEGAGGWSAWASAVEDRLFELYQAKKLVTDEQFGRAFQEISEGLKEVRP